MNLNKFQKISISLFLAIFLFSAFYFLFFNKVLVGGATGSWEDQETICNNACAHLEGAEQDDCFNNCMEGGSSIDIACDKYGYPWCKDTEPGIAPLVNKFYTIALGFAAAAALGVLIYGAILWTLSGAVTSKQDAMEWIKGALWGLGLLLGAYLILWTINPKLVELEDPMKYAPEITIPAPETSPTGGCAGCDWPIGAPPSGTYSDAQGRSALAPGVSVNKSNCYVVGQQNCTSLDGISESIIQNTNDLQKAAGVLIVITGGTEYWLHGDGTETGTQHVPGGTAIDYGYDPAVLEAVKKSEKVSYYQCEYQGIKVYGCAGTIDHIHVEY